MEDKLKIEQFSQLWEAKHQIFAHKFFKIAKTQFWVLDYINETREVLDDWSWNWAENQFYHWHLYPEYINKGPLTYYVITVCMFLDTLPPAPLPKSNSALERVKFTLA